METLALNNSEIDIKAIKPKGEPSKWQVDFHAYSAVVISNDHL